MGYAVELDQFLSDSPSGFSHEDLPSNAAGASFGTFDYDPGSELTLGEQIRDWLNKEARAIDDPRKAPYFDLLPATYNENNPDPPKNFAPKPYDLKKLPIPNQDGG